MPPSTYSWTVDDAVKLLKQAGYAVGKANVQEVVDFLVLTGTVDLGFLRGFIDELVDLLANSGREALNPQGSQWRV